MKSFSQRQGLKPVRTLIQRESADIILRNYLWNGLTLFYWNISQNDIRSLGEPLKTLFKRIWVNHFNERIDEIENYAPSLIFRIKNDFLNLSWNEMFDILEFIPNNFHEGQYHGGLNNKRNQEFIAYTNSVLESNLSAYRFVNMLITEISSEEEIASIEDALENSSKYTPVQIHLSRALELFADRKNPDFRNSIKESISAIEAFASIITNNSKATLGQALKEIEKKHEIHPALKSSFSSLYGYTSDENGIRHSLLEESTLKQEDARFILVACSAFINYLLIKTNDQ